MMTKNIIFTTLALLIITSFYLLNKDINQYSQMVEEQQTQIDDLKKQLGYHDIRLSGQMDTLMVQNRRCHIGLYQCCSWITKCLRWRLKSYK